MKMIDKFQRISLQTALDIFVPMFVMEHDWSDYDKLDKLVELKKEYVENELLNEVKQGRLTGEIINKIVTDEDGIRQTDVHDEPIYELDYIVTWFDIKEAFKFLHGILNKVGATSFSTIKNSDDETYNENVEVDIIDAATIESVELMSVPILKKKVAELTNEKKKWDRSIAVATQIGILFFEKELVRPATEKLFKEDYNKHFSGLPNSTVSKIYKYLPETYRNTGGSPSKVPEGVDDHTIDMIIEASTFAGYLSKKEGIDVLEELEERLTEDEYETPTNSYITAIKKGCKKVIRKYI